MIHQPKPTIMHSNLFTKQKTQFYTVTSHFFSQIKNLRSSSASTKISIKSCKASNSLLKNNHFNGSLFEEAHRTNPAIQSYLPKSIQPISNQEKMKALILLKQKSQRSSKNSKKSKSVSINRIYSKCQQESNRNEEEKQDSKNIVVPMSSLTFLIINECQYQPENQNKKENTNKTKPIISSLQSNKPLKSTQFKRCQSSCDNPYELLPLRRAKCRKQNNPL